MALQGVKNSHLRSRALALGDRNGVVCGRGVKNRTLLPSVPLLTESETDNLVSILTAVILEEVRLEILRELRKSFSTLNPSINCQFPLTGMNAQQASLLTTVPSEQVAWVLAGAAVATVARATRAKREEVKAIAMSGLECRVLLEGRRASEPDVQWKLTRRELDVLRTLGEHRQAFIPQKLGTVPTLSKARHRWQNKAHWPAHRSVGGQPGTVNTARTLCRLQRVSPISSGHAYGEGIPLSCAGARTNGRLPVCNPHRSVSGSDIFVENNPVHRVSAMRLVVCMREIDISRQRMHRVGMTDGRIRLKSVRIPFLGSYPTPRQE